MVFLQLLASLFYKDPMANRHCACMCQCSSKAGTSKSSFYASKQPCTMVDCKTKEVDVSIVTVSKTYSKKKCPCVTNNDQ